MSTPEPILSPAIETPQADAGDALQTPEVRQRLRENRSKGEFLLGKVARRPSDRQEDARRGSAFATVNEGDIAPVPARDRPDDR